MLGNCKSLLSVIENLKQLYKKYYCYQYKSAIILSFFLHLFKISILNYINEKNEGWKRAIHQI